MAAREDLVLGDEGLIGSSLVRALKAPGNGIYSLDFRSGCAWGLWFLALDTSPRNRRATAGPSRRLGRESRTPPDRHRPARHCATAPKAFRATACEPAWKAFAREPAFVGSRGLAGDPPRLTSTGHPVTRDR